MRDIKRVEFQDPLLCIWYTDDIDPQWIEERQVAINWEQNAHVLRLSHTAWHILNLLVEYPQLVEKHDEILTEWLTRLFDECPTPGHDTP